MSPQDDTVAEFMAWVNDNYGDPVKSALEVELAKDPCNTKAKLFKKLCEVLGEQDDCRLHQTTDLSVIYYNS